MRFIAGSNCVRPSTPFRHVRKEQRMAYPKTVRCAKRAVMSSSPSLFNVILPIHHRKVLGAGLVPGRRRALYLFDLFTMIFQLTSFQLYAVNVTSAVLKHVYFCLSIILLLLQYLCVCLCSHCMIIGVFVPNEGSGGVVMYSECTR